MLYLAIDGDDVGPILRGHIIRNDLSGARHLSNSITQHFIALRTSLELSGANVIFVGGDSLLAETPNVAADLEQIRNPANGLFTVSVGIGHSPITAYLALQLAKAFGKNQIQNFWDVMYLERGLRFTGGADD